jgi:hypothetical protein
MIASFLFHGLRRLAVAVIAVLAFAQFVSVAEPPKPPGGPPPLPGSPIQEFREWLAMKPEERVKAVQGWPAEKQKVLLAKLRAYEVLPAAERERRLQILELRWYLRPLMGMNAEERKPALALVPAELRALVLERLKSWDALDAESRKEILASDDARELVTRYFLQVQQGHSPEQIKIGLPPEKRQELERALSTWNSLSLATRTRTAAQLTAFFRLSSEQQARTVEQFPESERQEIQKTLDAFAKLPAEQRRVCVESFEKFTLMPPPERASFLRNAARWEAMTPQERATWKQLVTKLPPLPPVPLREPPTPQASLPAHGMAQSEDAR